MTDLFAHGLRTALTCWTRFADARAGAEVRQLPGVAVACFPDAPEAAVYNNGVLAQKLSTTAAAAAIGAMERAYAASGVTRFAAWVHESDAVVRAELEGRGYHVDEWTLAMGAELTDLRVPEGSDSALMAVPVTRHFEVLGRQGAPTGLNVGVDPTGFAALVATVDGEDVATALAFDSDGDCGIYNVGTDEAFRRRGLGTALMTRALADARIRGCRTVTLQSSPMAVSMYAALGFRDLGRILEYAR
jgi:ribosomal protein S18 acetylase RimI-like enzyme